MKKILSNTFKKYFNEDFIKNYDEDSDKGYIFEADVEYPKDLHDLLSELPFLPEKIKLITAKACMPSV